MEANGTGKAAKDADVRPSVPRTQGSCTPPRHDPRTVTPRITFPVTLTGDWEREFELLVEVVRHMPPSLVEGFLMNVTRVIYGRGIAGLQESRTRMPKEEALKLVDGKVSRMVRGMEKRLRNELRKTSVKQSHGGKDLDVPARRLQIGRTRIA